MIQLHKATHGNRQCVQNFAAYMPAYRNWKPNVTKQTAVLAMQNDTWNHSGETTMTQNTDQERELFEAFASDDGKWLKDIERDSRGNYLLLTTAVGWMWWQAARRAPVVPHGWKLVPVEPTEKMVNEGSCAQTTQHGHGYIGEYAAKTAWQHMLAAAPKPPEPAQHNDKECEK